MKKFIWTIGLLAIGCNGPIYDLTAPTNQISTVSPAPAKVIITAPLLLAVSGLSNQFSVQATDAEHHPCFNQKVVWSSPDGVFFSQDYTTDLSGVHNATFRLYQTLLLLGLPPATITAAVSGVSQTIQVQIVNGVAP